MRIKTSIPFLALLFTYTSLLFGASQDWFVYVLSNSNFAIPINATTNTLGAPILVGSQPFKIAIAPNGERAYLTNRASNSVSVIDLNTNIQIAVIGVGNSPTGIAITPDGRTVYVTNFGSNTVTPIDTATLMVGSPIFVGMKPFGIAITPNGKTAYVTLSGSGSIIPLAIATNTVGPAITGIASFPTLLAITPDGQTGYVVDLTGNAIRRFDTTTHTVLPGSIAVGFSPQDIAITSDGIKAYVVNQNTNDISVIDIVNNAVSTTIHSIPAPMSIVLAPNNLLGYVTSTGHPFITRINLTTNTSLGPIMLGVFGSGLAITPDQSPAALFIATIAQANLPSTFDASSSTSAVGTITNYRWDFGDGHTATTSTPIITHIYTSGGTYNVVLKVTNSAGTSTTQTFTGQTVSNNGSAKAMIARKITVPNIPLPPRKKPKPPQKFSGKIIKNGNSHHIKLKLKAKWKPSKPTNNMNDVISYKIFENKKLVATIPSHSKLTFKKQLHPQDVYKKHLQKYRKVLHKRYKIRAVDSTGELSSSVHLKVKKMK